MLSQNINEGNELETFTREIELTDKKLANEFLSMKYMNLMK